MTTKQALLEQLLAHTGEHFSGQQLAVKLGISRMAVNKAARELKKQGWKITATAGLGYCLERGSDALTAEALRAAWSEYGGGEVLPQPYVFSTLPSTNHTARELVAAGAPHGTVVLAGEQTEGRGRLGRSFDSPAGTGTYLTLILHPRLDAADALSVTGSAAVAVARAVRRLCGLELSIKWVNDLYYKGKKVCGILTEASTDFETGRVEWLAVGIGINLTTEFTGELASIAGSLFPGGVSPVSRAVLAAGICSELLALCPGFDYLEEYRARCFVPGHWVTVHPARPGQEPWTGKAVAIDDRGCLVVEEPSGRRIALSHGEVSVRPAVAGN